MNNNLKNFVLILDASKLDISKISILKLFAENSELHATEVNEYDENKPVEYPILVYEVEGETHEGDASQGSPHVSGETTAV